MNSKKHFRSIQGLAACAALALIVLFGSSNSVRAADSVVATQPAPGWKLKDLNGREVSSDNFKGKVVVVDFWATWCGPCVGEIPGYIELQKKYGADRLVIVGISLDRSAPAQVKKFVEAKGINYLIVMGDDAVVDAFGGIEAIPTTFLINREGRVVHRKQGAMPHDEYEGIVKQALAP